MQLTAQRLASTLFRRILSFSARLFAAAFLVISLLFPVACNNRDSGAEEALPRSTTAEPVRRKRNGKRFRQTRRNQHTRNSGTSFHP